MRNALCPLYSECLDPAAFRNLTFDCGGCPYEFRRESFQVGLVELAGCLSLLLAVVNPEAFERAKGVDGFRRYLLRRLVKTYDSERSRNFSRYRAHRLKEPGYF